MTADNVARFIRSGPPALMPVLAAMLLCTIFQLVPASRAFSQSAPDLESRKQAAYQKFHHGQVREAAREIAELAKQETDKRTKAYLLRDLTEMCSTAYELGCALEAEVAAYEIVKDDDALKPLFSDLYAYFVRAQVWANNPEILKGIFRDNKVAFNPAATPYPAASANLAAVTYFLRSNEYRLVEKAYSSAVVSLLLIDPKDKYSICKVLAELLESLITQQDIASAQTLARLIDPYMAANLNHEGPIFANYVMLITKLIAMTTRSKQVAGFLEEGIRVNDRLDINDSIKLYRTSTSNSLASLSTLFEGTPDEAAAVHARHPLQPQREAILARGHFETLQEFYFALSDLLIDSFKDRARMQVWKPLFGSLPEEWQLKGLIEEDIESYRHFALGLITAETSKAEAAALVQTAARERIEVFETFLTRRFEGFQLPTLIDLLVIESALTTLAEFPPADAADLALKGSEMLSRTLRHQTSDFAVLIGAQKTERARAAVRSYYLLLQQKRQWEFDQIKVLMAGDKKEAGYLITTYAHLTQTVTQLGETLAKGEDYAKAIGYPRVAQIQPVLQPHEVFLTYFLTLKGMGRLCISGSTALYSVSDIDPQQAIHDAKLLRLALTQERAADETLDSQYPVEAAIRLKDLMFKGLDACVPPGSLVNVAPPDELAGIPFAALLEEAPPQRGDGYDLSAARWLGKTYRFATSISARHFLGMRASVVHQHAPLPYLGIGDPSLASVTTQASLTRGGTTNASLRGALSELGSLPETADEVHSVASLLKAPKRDVLLGTDASEEDFRSKELGKYDIIHFATHGLLRNDVPGLNEASLVLTPNDLSDSFDDGLLTASEITRLPLEARLVVLSACNTARIDTSAANIGITDLAAAFSVAGTPTLLASLWTVETNATHDLMLEFFRSWNGQQNKSASLALSDGIERYLAKADRAHHHPRFWAPFIVFGYGASQIEQDARATATTVDYRHLGSDDVGEVFDARPLADRLVLSVMGDWDGKTMASIIRDATSNSAPAFSKSHEIGAGKLLVDQSQVYAFGYKVSVHPYPIVRRFTPDGTLVWEKAWPDLVDDMPYGSLKVGNDIVMLSGSTYSSKEDRIAHLVRFDPDGHEAARKEIKVGMSEFIIGQWALLSRVGPDLALIVNSRQFGNFGSSEALFGLPTLCQGPLESTIYLLDAATLEVKRTLTIPDLQVVAAEGDQQGLRIGGQTRGPCEDSGKGLLLQVTPELTSSPLWKDDDPFPSNIQSLTVTDGETLFAVKRQRPIGVRRLGAVSPEVTTKRWGDDGNELLEFSLLKLSADGGTISLYNSAFGLSAFAQGVVFSRGKPVIYGSLGGRPAISAQQ
ncbi:CHAT domain-containing protein [Bradyrhizobium sp. LCT2]|uniref:CHAT domain-containing protein n=1 Tax=Bradyrhizobium sp. LCT2 TaxID=2493093 RepID=UPI001374E883|nr:CHAT domain-containing protein [Bradyrhizobium sp. LCT2]